MPGPWSYETRTERTTRLARVQAQPKDYGSQLDSFLSDRLNKIGIDPGVLASAPPQPAQQAPASATPPTTDRRILQQSADKRAQMASGLTTPQGDSGGGFLSDFASDVKDVAAGALHAGLSVAAKPFELSSQYGSPVFSALTGESRAGRHPILDANGQPTGQFYRDKPDFRDMGASLLGLVTNPVSEYQRGQGAVNERINNPQVQKDFVGRGALRTFSDPLQVGIAALSGGSTALAAPAFNIATEGATQYAQDLPGWRNLSPDVQQALILAGSVIAAKKGPAIAKKAAELTGLKDAYQMGAVPGAAMVQGGPTGAPIPPGPRSLGNVSDLEALGLKPGANYNADQLKTAYREQARQYHPDLNQSPTASADMSRLNSAYDTLRAQQIATDNGRAAPGAADWASAFKQSEAERNAFVNDAFQRGAGQLTNAMNNVDPAEVQRRVGVPPPDTAAGSAAGTAPPAGAPPLAPDIPAGGIGEPVDTTPPGGGTVPPDVPAVPPSEPPSGGLTPPAGGDQPLPTVQVGPFQLPTSRRRP